MKDNGAAFDAPFFSITKSEAMTMDTQQRLIMENVYHAIENGTAVLLDRRLRKGVLLMLYSGTPNG